MLLSKRSCILGVGVDSFREKVGEGITVESNRVDTL